MSAITSRFHQQRRFPIRQVFYWTAGVLAIAVAPFLMWPTLSGRIMAADFLPHIYCYLGKPGLTWTHVIADSVIGLSYFTISGVLVHLIQKGRRDIPFPWMFLAFGLFIVACGGTHFMEVVTVWFPVYVLSASLKVVTAVVSVASVVLLLFTFPQIFALIQNAKASEAAEGKFRALMDAAPDALVAMNREGTIALVNSHVERLFGYRREELLERQIESLIPLRFRNEHLEYRLDLFTEPRVRSSTPSLELLGLHKEGHEFPIEISLSALQTEESVQVVSSIRDITERKRSEQALRESEDRYRSLVEALPDAIFVICEERIVFVNPFGVKLLRAQRAEQIVGKECSELIHPDSLASIRRRIQLCHETGVAAPPMEHRLVALDGSSVEIESASIPITWKGAPAVEAIVRDIGARKRSEERLREYEKAVEGLEEMITVVDHEYRYVLANRAFLNYRGLEKEQVIGRLSRGLLNEGVFDTVIKKKLDECLQGKVVKYELRYNYPRLGERDISVSYFPIEGPDRVDRVACVLRDITERKQAEVARARLAVIVESSDDAIISKDLNGVVTSWNAGAQHIFGYTEAEALGRPITIIIPPELFGEEEGILQRLRAGDRIRHYETIRVTKDGKRIDVSLTISPMKDSEGKVVGASKIARDITERKQAEKTLQRSESEAKAQAEELAAILDAVPGMALVARDPACRKITGSRVAYELLHLPYGANISKSAREEERPSHFRIIRGGKELPANELPVQKAAASGREVRESEVTLQFDDGTSRHMFGNAAPLFDRERNVRGAVGVFVDITQRKQAEQSLKVFRELVDQSNDAIEVIDPHTFRFIDINGRACSDLGYSREELLSMKVYDIDPNVDESLYLRVMDELRKSGSTVLESLHRRKDGSTFPVEVSVKYVHLERIYIVTAVRDITERKRSEQTLQETQAALARVTRVTSMGELTASIAHEINQPLAAVTTNTSASLRWLAAQPPNLDEARKAADSAIREANRASEVIARIRALLKKAPPQMEPVDVNEIIKEVLRLVAGELTRSAVTAKTMLAASGLVVLGDRVQLQQVILNLIMNAIDAMITITDRSRTLLIKSANDTEGALVQVQDSARGLDPEYAERIFEPFFTTKPEGIGMGLAISRSIVETHGGRLWATPGSPHGAVFQLILPKIGSRT
jgi:PAS domain S-box-containing protein